MIELDPNSEVRFERSYTKPRYPYPGALFLFGWPSSDNSAEGMSLHNRIVIWCSENIENFEADDYGIYLFSEEDAMAMRLTWE